MTHLPTAHADVYRCPVCSFHAVATCDGFHVIDSGAGRQLHLDAIVQQQIEQAATARQMTEASMARLRAAYDARRALPEADDNIDDLVAAGIWPARVLSLRQLQRLYRAVAGEWI